MSELRTIRQFLSSEHAQDREALLAFVRETPLVYGPWHDFKWLTKHAEDTNDSEILAALMARIDATPTATAARLAMGAGQVIDNDVVTAVMSGHYAYVISKTQARSNALRVIDLSDPASPKEVASLKVGISTQLRLSGTRLYVFAPAVNSYARNKDIIVLEMSDPTKPTNVATYTPQNGIVDLDVRGNTMYLIGPPQSYGQDPILYTYNLTNANTLTPLGSQKIPNGKLIRVSENHAFVLTEQNWNVNAVLSLIDISDVSRPRLANSIPAANTTDLAIHGRFVFLTLNNHGPNSYYGIRQGRDEMGLQVVEVLPAGLLRPMRLQSIAKLDLGNAHSVALAGQYAYVGTEQTGSKKEKNLRRGGLKVVDITAPATPKVVGSIDGPRVTGVNIGGNQIALRIQDSAYGRSQLQIADAILPQYPALLGNAPSADTIGYMKRRARRHLRTLAATHPDVYVHTAFQILTQSPQQTSLDFAVQWVSIDILYGNSKRPKQMRHGRGKFVIAPKFVFKTREERAPEAWDGNLDLAVQLVQHTNASWQARKLAIQVLRANGRELPQLDIATLEAMFTSGSPLLLTVAAHQAVARQRELTPKQFASAYFWSNSRVRRQLAAEFVQQSPGAEFATALFDLAAGHQKSRRQSSVLGLLASQFSHEIPAANLLPYVGTLLQSPDAQVRGWVYQLAETATGKTIAQWLDMLAPLPPQYQEAGLAALLTGFKRQAMSFETAKSLVYSSSEWIRRSAWQLLAISLTVENVYRTLWTAILSEDQNSLALQTALTSRDALATLDQAQLGTNYLTSLVQERPYLVELLSGPLFSEIAQALPAVVTIQLIAAASEQTWQTLREAWLRSSFTSEQLTEFWQAAFAALLSQSDGPLAARLIDDTAIAETFVRANDVSLLKTDNPVFGALLVRWLPTHNALFPADSPALLEAATHALPEVREWALAHAQFMGMGLAFALRLGESEIPACVATSKRWFMAIPQGDPNELDDILALCDSPEHSVRAFGLGFIETRWDNISQQTLLARLTENPNPEIQSFVADKLLTFEGTLTEAKTFDREVLRTRNKSRSAKELVKQRLESQEVGEIAVLLEMARSRIPRDSEWALSQLARLALSGTEINGITLDGVAGI